MKQIYVLTILSIINYNTYSQVHYAASINFETNSQLVEIDTSQTNNIWQIGIPNKVFLDSSYSAPLCIITDTINNYPINNFSSFQIKILPPPNSCWGIGYMYFMHKYDFEQNKDGGYIEVKYDNDTTWTNIIFDTDPEVFIQSSYFYSDTDTIIGNIPAFTGNSNGWISSGFWWAWQIGVKNYFHDSLTIRFSMKSDSINTNQEGWLIDDIYLQLGDCTGNISSNNLQIDDLNIYPNPVNNISTIEFANKSNVLTTVKIFDSIGKEVKCINSYSTKVQIDKNDFSNGIFHFKIFQNEDIISVGKFLISK